MREEVLENSAKKGQSAFEQRMLEKKERIHKLEERYAQLE